MSNHRIIEVVGQRPSVVPHDSLTHAGEPIPADWLIFNTTRPLYGLAWTGEWVSGIFFAAVDPGDANLITLNRNLDGAELHYITTEAHKARVDAWWANLLATEYAGEDFSWIEYEQIEDMFRQNHPVRVFLLEAA
jgi:hypothetical protein